MTENNRDENNNIIIRDGEDILVSVYGQLKDLYEYLQRPDTVPNNKKVLEEIKEVLDLGDKIFTFEYGKEADRLFHEYGNISWLEDVTEDPTFNLWLEETNKAIKERHNDINKFFKLIGKKINNWW